MKSEHSPAVASSRYKWYSPHLNDVFGNVSIHNISPGFLLRSCVDTGDNNEKALGIR